MAAASTTGAVDLSKPEMDPKYGKKPSSANMNGEALDYNAYEKHVLSVIEKELEKELAADPQHPTVLTRFIRGYAQEKDPVKTTVEHLREMLAWRKEYGVDELMKKELPRADRFRELWPAGGSGVGKEGRPVYVERLGRVDPSVILKEFTAEEMLQHHVVLVERLSRRKMAASEKLGKPTYKHIAVLDLAGFGTKHMSKKFYGQVKQFIKVDGDYFPESLHRMIICNAPFLFRGLWAIVSPWVHPLTRERIKMGSKHLKDYIDPENIPKFLGGKAPDVLDPMAPGAPKPAEGKQQPVVKE